jgi:hypothetical protein
MPVGVVVSEGAVEDQPGDGRDRDFQFRTAALGRTAAQLDVGLGQDAGRGRIEQRRGIGLLQPLGRVNRSEDAQLAIEEGPLDAPFIIAQLLLGDDARYRILGGDLRLGVSRQAEETGIE